MLESNCAKHTLGGKIKIMSLIDQFLEACLPTKWSRLIAGLTIVTVGVTTYLPEFLQKYDIQLTKEKILLIRVTAPLLILLLGTFLVLLMVVQHYKNIKSQKQPHSPMPMLTTKPSVFPKEQVDILLCILEKTGDTLTFEIVQSLKMSEDIAKYHLQELCKKEFIGEGLPILPGQQSWNINDKGKKYLIENKLIT